jgi:rod shape determining protein RodA
VRGPRERWFQTLDPSLLCTVLALAGLGILSVYSATAAAYGPVLGAKQALWVALGLVALLVAVSVDYRMWTEVSPLIYGGALVALVVLLVAGESISGARSWFRLGPVRIQPSEFAKIATAMLLARVFAGHKRPRAGVGTLFAAGLVAGLPLVLVAAQPDMGTALSFAALFLATVYLTGLTRKLVIVLGLAGALSAVGGWLFVLKDYQKERILTFFRPESDPLAAGYQTIQSKIAIGSGGLLGKGFGSGTQSQLDFLPEKRTDFIFSVLAEEWGFVGTLLVLGLYLLLLVGLATAAAGARDRLGVYLATSIMVIVAVHVAINLGMVTGLMPTIGIPLPLVSYGGSSMVSTLFAVGLVMSVRMRRFANQ